MARRPRDEPTRVAIIGGGCAALASAFELTRPEQEGRFAVTVYQMGWRLGGKGASGRGPHGRIEEHGLHLWMGYYENAFRLMRECYAELGRVTPRGARLTFEEAFLPAPFNGAMDWTPEGTWVPWKVKFPPMPGLPGDPAPPALGVAEFLGHAAKLLGTLLSSVAVDTHLRDAARRPERDERALSDENLGAAVARLASYGAAAGLAAAIEAVSWLELALGALATTRQVTVFRLIDLAKGVVRAELSKIARANDTVRRTWEVAELILATLRGCVQFRLAFDPRGFDAIDDYDCRDWLRLNGASEAAVNSAFIRALYDLAFAYADGDPERPAIAAGAALRGAFRAFFTYRGAFFWKMAAGMGDAVFAPLYEVLRHRGVRFEFFHKLTSVGLSPPSLDAPHVATLDFDVQARTVSGKEYSPLVAVKGLPCWPSIPDYEQLVGGEELRKTGIDFESQWDGRKARRKTLRVGADFDFVVLGVGLGVVRSVCSSILERDERWRVMAEKVTSVPTQAFQLWLDRDIEALGWPDGTINVSGYVEPFDTWADMTHVAVREDWEPRSIAYFCNVLRDEPGPRHDAAEAARFVARAHDAVRSHCIDFLNDHVQALWPRARDASGEFLWDALYCPDAGGARGGARFATQYWTANVRPSDRYTQCLPGSTKYRISPLDRTYDNLTLAGDWTSSSINMGCVEAAVMSGLLASHALSGLPKLSDITGYDHP